MQQNLSSHNGNQASAGKFRNNVLRIILQGIQDGKPTSVGTWMKGIQRRQKIIQRSGTSLSVQQPRDAMFTPA